MSRKSLPKQFLDFLGTGQSLLQATYERFRTFLPTENIYVVTNLDYVDLVKEQLPYIPNNNILGEPLARNTAPCVAYATYKIADEYKGGTCIIAPSDHLILNEDAFRTKVAKAVNFAQNNDSIVTLGIKPTRPDTGYGYIQYIENEGEVHKVKTFTEKPNLELAESFLSSGDFLWNSGMFIWTIETIQNAFAEYMPEVEDVFRQGLGAYNTKVELEFVASAYTSVVPTSIDYGIIEKAENVHVIPSDFGWSDLGTWKSVYEHNRKDDQGNTLIKGLAHLNDSSNNLIATDNPDKLVVLEGVNDLFIVDTKDSLLICNSDREQEVKRIVGEVRKKFNDQFN